MSQAYFVAIAWPGLCRDLRYHARGSTQEHPAGIRKLATGDGDRFCRTNT